MAEAQTDKKARSEFLAAGDAGSDGLLREMLDFLRDSKKWWLAPIIVGLLLIGLGIVIGGSAAAPFIYATF